MQGTIPSFQNLLFSIFTRGSITYSVSSLFFPRQVRERVSAFYAFVRVIDNMVDEQPVQPRAFYAAKRLFYGALDGTPTSHLVMQNFASLARERALNRDHLDAFFESMEWDLQPTFGIDSMEQCIRYMHGSAEIVALIMYNLCDLQDEELLFHAARLGRSMQYVNFIRDLNDDTRKGRRYIPLIDTPLADLSEDTARAHEAEFCAFIRRELLRYAGWLEDSLAGMRRLPLFIRAAIVTSAQLYHDNAARIYKDPMSLFSSQGRTKKSRALYAGVKNLLLRARQPRITAFENSLGSSQG